MTDVVRGVLRGIGELLVTAGLVVLLFVVYQLVWTNVEAGRAQDRVSEQIRDDWTGPPRNTPRTGPAGEIVPARGQGFAFLRIPRLGDDYVVPVVQGVGLDELARGVGHYPDSARPGAVGNFAVAGHRATNGEPFADLDRLRRGDVVVTETRRSWFTYVVDRSRIVSPTATWVVGPTRARTGVEPSKRLLTLTTCHPRWSSEQRLVVFGHLQEQRSKSDGPPAVLARGN